MPSTTSTPVGVRIPNEQLTTLRRLADLLGTTTSCLIAVCVEKTLEQLRGATE